MTPNLVLMLVLGPDPGPHSGLGTAPKFRSVSIKVKIMSKFKVREDQHHKKRVRSGTE